MGKRGPKPNPGKTAAMYADYCQGMSTAEVAEKWGVTSQAVSNRFLKARLPRRPSRGGPGMMLGRSVEFSKSNEARTAAAAPRTVAAASAALAAARTALERSAMELRVAYPDLSLAALAKLHDPPLTKDAFWSHLRRGLARAERSSVS